MNTESQIYEKTFSRDFTLAIIEIWYRGEATNPKQWTTEQQPFVPFIVFERSEGLVHGYYNPQGITWVKNLLLKKAREEKEFLIMMEKNIEKQMEYLQPIFDLKKALPQQELIKFLTKLELYWPWFEAAWWLWESTPEERAGIELNASFMKLRVTTQNVGLGSDTVIRKSLEKIYPDLKERIAVIRTEEIISGKIPDSKELEKRFQKYFFTNNQLYVGVTKTDIEKELNIEFEKIRVEKTLKEIKGQSVIKRESVRGTVKRVMSSAQIGKVKEGDIIVSPMTLPDFLPAMTKAAAIVTDEGGMLCHAAIVARELKKPCIIGTKIATEVLKDGDLVEVDAEKGIVKKLS